MQDTGARPYPRPKRRASTPPGPGGVPAAAAATTTTGKRANTQGNDGGETEEYEEEGPVGLVPYPLRAAAILEDAYQFLTWHLECEGGAVDRGSASGTRSEGGGEGKAGRGRAGGSSSSPTVLLTVQVRRFFA